MKFVSRDQISEVVDKNKAVGKILVFTNGCFDIIHAGHVRYLSEAKKLGDCLIVGLNSDRSVQELKGPTRPLNHQEDRAEVVAALAAVDYVVIFDERTAESLVNEVKPDIYVKGGDYRIQDIPEAKIVASNGGKTILIPEVPGRSSTNIIKKITETT
ncbi:D-glycero-beta-D-manno-heptose 1-phosphate adenylyltransferase [Anaerospora hongkongensis]|uniref:D-glycero-beta-D-manno-heptose 1-phosphate adenylyltransferase n=1 Tax=Anaerospora hongkongensis TaxID=244830 RepID=UPI00289C5A94|nr:D-glycero-beta-D-manno-heptose 1-phosphate adenylyltransferase [Anaerospora hongkongensis]